MITLTFTATSGNVATIEVRSAADGDELRIGGMVRWRNPETEQDGKDCEAFFTRTLAGDGIVADKFESVASRSTAESRQKVSAFLYFGDANCGGNG